MNVAKKLGVFLLVLGLAGCAATGMGADPKDVVAKQALSRWDALIKGDVAAAYEYLSPGTREVMSLDLYKTRIRVGGWHKAKVDTVSCEQDRCDVSLLIEYSYRDMKSIETRLNESWIQDSGKWWYVPRK